MKIQWMMIARVLVALLFVVSGFGMLMDFQGTVGYFSSMGIPMASLVLAVVLFVKIVGGITFAYGKKYADWAGYALAVFTLATIVMAHSNIADQMQLIQALKNLAIVGGIIALTPCTCGSCDKCEVKKA